MNTDREIVPTNRIKRRKIFLLAFVILVGGLLLPMGVIRAASEMRQAVYPPATGGAGLIHKTDDQYAGKTNDKGSGGFSQATTGTVESAESPLAGPDLEISKSSPFDFEIGAGGGSFSLIVRDTTQPP